MTREIFERLVLSLLENLHTQAGGMRADLKEILAANKHILAEMKNNQVCQ